MLDYKTLQQKFTNSGIVEQTIYVNVALFLLTFVGTIFKSSFFYDWFSLPSNFKSFTVKPWTIVSYGFLHVGFIHLISNLIGLFYLGNLFINYFTRKQFINFYVLGTITGGIFYLLGSDFFSQFDNTTIPLVGASAAVSAILIGLATYLPNYQLRFALIGYIKLWHIAVFWLAYNIIFITASYNIGGNLAHLGGGLFGFMYVQFASNKKIELFSWRKKKTSHLKTAYKNVKPKKTTVKSANQQEIDKILDKISKSGYDSLNNKEKEFLFKQGDHKS